MFVFAFNYCTCALLINFFICFASCYHKNSFHLFTRGRGGIIYAFVVFLCDACKILYLPWVTAAPCDAFFSACDFTMIS